MLGSALLPPTPTHTQTHAYTHTHAHTLTHTRTHTEKEREREFTYYTSAHPLTVDLLNVSASSSAGS